MHHHIPRGAAKLALYVVGAPVVGVARSWRLITKGGCLGVLGGLVGLTPYLLSLIAFFLIPGAIQASTVPAVVGGCPGLFCGQTVITAHLDTGTLVGYAIVLLAFYWVLVGIGYGTQWLFANWSKVSLSELSLK